VIPPDEDEAFVAAMETVLEVYQHPEDPAFPVVAMDERPVQLLGDIRDPVPAKPGRIARVDYEYRRNRKPVCAFLFTAPFQGYRHVSVRERRTAIDWAEEVKHLLDDTYPDAVRVTLVCDNLNIHKLASLYKAFPPDEAQRLESRLELVHTPKHGSWLNIAEIELSVFSRQCLSRRIPDLEMLRSEAAAWAAHRNQVAKPVNWRFTTQDARIKLKRLYPKT
jgi:hypothetical protein